MTSPKITNLRSLFHGAVLLTAWLGTIPAAPAAIVTTGFTNFVDPTTLFIGSNNSSQGAGTLEINGGSTLAANSIVAVSSTDSQPSSVTVTGAGSLLTTDVASFGSDGRANLTVTNGGDIVTTSSSGILRGAATISGVGSTWTGGSTLKVGPTNASGGRGALSITGGATVEHASAEVGVSLASNGGVTVSGAGSSWTLSGPLDLGTSGGVGELTVDSGGSIANGEAEIGRGEALISGANSSWTTNGQLSVGVGGAGTVRVAAGGQVTSTGDLQLGNDFFQAFGSGVVEVSGGSSLTNANAFIGGGVGNSGRVEVTGIGSTWTNTGSLQIGSDLNQSQGQVRISFGASASAAQMALTRGNVELDAGDLDLAGNLFIDQGTLEITNGGSLTSPGAGSMAQIRGGAMTVTDAGSTWTSSGSITVGGDTGGSLNVTDGGFVSTTSFVRIGNPSDSPASAVIDGAGSEWNVDANFIIANGTLQVSDGGVASGDQLNIQENGSVALNGGTLRFRTMNNGEFGVSFPTGSGVVELMDAYTFEETTNLPAGMTFDVDNTVTVDSAAELVVSGTLQSTSLQNDGTLVLIGSTLDQPVTSPAGSTINVIGDVTFNGAVSGAGGVFGSGTATFAGGYSPGDSPADVTIENDVAFAATNTLTLELGGLGAGQSDALTVGGDATLDGMLDVDLLNGFTLGNGQTFEVLDVDGQLSGEFTGLAERALVGQHGGVDLFITYAGGDGNDVVLFTAPLLPGDYNNGVVDAADYTVWRDNQGAPAGSLPNDNNPGPIGQGHYDTWASHFGQSIPLQSASVPEPTAFTLLRLGLGTRVRRR